MKRKRKRKQLTSGWRQTREVHEVRIGTDWLFRITFDHLKGFQTKARVTALRKGKTYTSGVGVALLSKRDTYDKAKGKVVALGRAMANSNPVIPKPARTALWVLMPEVRQKLVKTP